MSRYQVELTTVTRKVYHLEAKTAKIAAKRAADWGELIFSKTTPDVEVSKIMQMAQGPNGEPIGVMAPDEDDE